MKIPRIVLAGATSGVGKTLVSCGLIHALRGLGYSVQPFKVGPDYIDPGYLSSASGRDARNLDAWLMGRRRVLESFTANSACDVSVIEGVMGFYDGARGDSDFASTHHVASITRSPVVLVLDASKASRSVAATALGFQRFHRNSRISGIILNRIGSERHESLCRQALRRVRLPVLGAVYKDASLELESRHLGLVPAAEGGRVRKRLAAAARSVADSLDMEGIVGILTGPPPLPRAPGPAAKKARAVIAVALDDSFNFYYRDNLDALRREGASLEFFSPARDRAPPESDGIYVGGGFPEIRGEALEKNRRMMGEIKKLSGAGMPVYAECGGLMYLTKSIDYGGRRYRMAGVFDAETRMTGRMRLNYTRGRAVAGSIISGGSRVLYGHEFHYSELVSVPQDSRFAYELEIGDGIEGGRDGLMLANTLASYGHLYFDRSDHARRFVSHCEGFSRR